jgi:hypothetical protein
MKVEIPGSMRAVVEHGKITKFVFIPHAADAGYFGDPIYVDSDALNSDTFFDIVSETLQHGEDASRFICEWES